MLAYEVLDCFDAEEFDHLILVNLEAISGASSASIRLT